MTTSSDVIRGAFPPPGGEGQGGGRFDVIFDDRALDWLREHPTFRPLVIAYNAVRC